MRFPSKKKGGGAQMNPFKVGWRKTNHQRRPKRNILKLGENQVCLESVKNGVGNTAEIWWEVSYTLRGPTGRHSVRQAPQTVQCRVGGTAGARGPGGQAGACGIKHRQLDTAGLLHREKKGGRSWREEGKWGQMEIFTVNMRKTWLCSIYDRKDQKKEAEDKEK